jgi:hypothetical protein
MHQITYRDLDGSGFFTAELSFMGIIDMGS